jgi:hypothetical protein
MIEYKAPSGGGGISNLKYIDVNLSNRDWTKLNTNPIELIPAVTNKTIMPISIGIQYSFGNVFSNIGGWGIGALNIFQLYGNPTAAQCFLSIISAVQNISGTIFLSQPNYSPTASSSASLSSVDTPLVIFDDANQAANNVILFRFKCLYLEI